VALAISAVIGKKSDTLSKIAQRLVDRESDGLDGGRLLLAGEDQALSRMLPEVRGNCG
jgi:hypothetical protein